MKKIIIKGLKEKSFSITNEILVIPQPQTMKVGITSYVFTEFTKLNYENIEKIDFLRDFLNEELALLNFPFILELEDQIIHDFELPEFNNEKQASEGYSLQIAKNMIVLIAESEQGIFYGIQTLLQLLYSDKNGISLPEIIIKDFPNFAIRAISDDISRGQVPTIENFKKFIRILSRFKINFFFIGYECDIFYYNKHPNIGVGRDPLKREEILEIQEYAKKFFVELVPLVTTTGHMDNVLMIPGYQDLGEFPGAQCFDISNNKVRIFLSDILEEICANFSSNYIHITCDELFDFGHYHSKKYLEQKGKELALLEHYNWMFDILKKQGKDKIIMYHDTVIKHKKIRQRLSRDIIIFLWEYFFHINFRRIKTLQKAGFNVIISPTIFDWSRNFPDIERGTKNIRAFIKAGYKRKVWGTAVSSWGDWGNESFRENRYYGYILSAELSWNTPNFDIKQFKKSFNKQFFGFTDNRITNIFRSLGDVNNIISGSISKLLATPLFYILLRRHPFPSKSPKIKTKQMLNLMHEMELTIKSIHDIKPFINKNKDYLDYLEFSAYLAKFFAKKNLAKLNISKLLQKTPIATQNRKKAIIIITELREELNRIKEKYQDLWLRCAKPEGLERLLPFYSWLDFIYTKKIEEIKANINWQNPFLEAEWIGYPEKKFHQDFRYFRKNFTLQNQKVKKAFLQGIANHYMKISINEIELGEVFSRFSLSVRPIDERVKVFDITKHLKKENIIIVEAANFTNYTNAINIYIEIFFENGEMQIIKSDCNWKTQETEIPGWKEIEFDDSTWKQAKSYGAPPKFNGEITKPYFLDNWPSQTTYMFGTRGYLKNFVPKIIISLVENFLKSIGA